MFAQFVALVALGFSQPVVDTVTIESPAMRLPDLVKLVGDATGENLVVSPELRNEIFVVSLKELSGVELKSKIADLLVAKWTMRTEGITLIPDLDKIKQDEMAHKSALAKLVKESKALLRDALAGRIQVPAGLEEEYSWVKDMFNEPDSRLWAQAALQIPDSVYVGLAEGNEAAFSTSPNRRQSQLNGAGMAPLLETWVKRQNDSVAESKKAMEEEDTSEEGRQYAEYSKLLYETYGDKLFGKLISTTPTKVIAVAEGAYKSGDLENPGSPQVRITIYDNTGQPVLGFQASLDMVYRQLKDIEEYLKYKKEHPEGEREQEAEKVVPPVYIKMPAETMKLLTAVKRDYSPSRAPMDGKVEALIHHPAEHEPLGLFVGDPVLVWAKSKGKQILAFLDDYNVSSLIDSITPQGIAEDTIEYIVSGEDGEVEEWNGVIVGRPSLYEPRYWESRIDREDLQGLVEVYERDYLPGLDVLGDFAARNPGAESNGVYMMVSETFRSLGSGFVVQSNSWEDLILWGSLSSGQRMAIRSGGQVRIAELGKQAQSQLTKRLTQGYVRLGNVADQMRKPIWEQMETMFTGEMEEEGYTNGRVEPSEVMPNGLPMQGFLQGQAVKEKYIVQLGPGGKMNDILSSPMSAEEAAYVKIGYEMQGAESPITLDNFNNMVMGDRTYIDLIVFVGPGTGTVVSYLDEKAPDLTKTFTLLGPPASFLAEMNLAAAKMNESPAMKLMKLLYQQYGQGGGRGVIKP